MLILELLLQIILAILKGKGVWGACLDAANQDRVTAKALYDALPRDYK